MKKVLVANRGEIARRVLRTLKKMNIQSVAIYSDADANAPHVLEADEAVYVGKSPSAESYLQQDLILKICKDLGVDGIHPGYGFLSENSGFARKVKEAGMKLIGPSPESMELMGDKLSAKQAVKEYNVPLVPGVDEAISDIPAAKRIAAEHQIKVHEGVYVGVTGPTFETRAEYQLIKIAGGDVVGMSTVQENIAAVHCGMKVFAMSVVTDLGIREDNNVITHEEVLAAANAAEPLLTLIFSALVKEVAA